MSRMLAIVVMVLLMTVLVTSGAFAQEAAPEDGGPRLGSTSPVWRQSIP